MKRSRHGRIVRQILLIAGALLPLLAGRTARTQESAAPSSSIYPNVMIHEEWITMTDGTKLAVNLFTPEGAKPDEKFPVLLEYLPYRKDDWAAARDYSLHSFFVKRGYVGARVDIRGTGRSEGTVPEREYSDQELRDGMEIIAWLARQPWCNGSVGMLGISWGGFNSIMMAMLHPPALKAIIAVDATNELFHDDIHYIDGLMHVDEFELSMDLQLPQTRAPDFPLDEPSLAARFDSPPWFPVYLKHQCNGEFWQRPAGHLPYDSIQIPVFLIGGFYDGYRDSVPHMMQQLKSPVKALVGPWNHTFPNDADPGPAIEWRVPALRWWDHWLKGKENGVEKDLGLSVYMRHWYAPDVNLHEVPGEWRSEPRWPPRDMKEEAFFLNSEHGLSKMKPKPAQHQLKYIPSAGTTSGFWWGDLTPDQRPTDAYSLVYDSAPLTQEMAILGLPRAILKASANAQLADWFVRLSDIAPDGGVTLITGAGLSGAQRNSSVQPEDLVLGKAYSLQIPLHFTSWVFPKNHRIRVAISNALWPMVWPTPYAMTTTLALGGSNPARIILPVVPVVSKLPAPRFAQPVSSDALPGVSSEDDSWPGTFSIEHDPYLQTAKIVWGGKDASRFPWGTMKSSEQITYKADDAHPEISSVHGEAATEFGLKDRVLTWKVDLAVSSDKTSFYYKYTRELLKDGVAIRTKTWEEQIPRDHQ